MVAVQDFERVAVEDGSGGPEKSAAARVGMQRPKRKPKRGQWKGMADISLSKMIPCEDMCGF